MDEWLTIGFIVDPEAERRFGGRARALLEITLAVIYVRERMLAELCMDVVFGAITFWDTVPFDNNFPSSGEHLQHIRDYIGSDAYGYDDHDHVSWECSAIITTDDAIMSRNTGMLARRWTGAPVQAR